jgi:hypothetical protein
MEASRLPGVLSIITYRPHAERQTPIRPHAEHLSPTRRYAHTSSLGYLLSARRRPEIMDTEMDKLENDHYHQDTKYPHTRFLVAR